MSRSIVFLPVLLVLVGLVGCGAKAQPADSSTARNTLQRALDAWKAGESPEDFQKSGSVTVSEPLWDKGTRLVKYDLQDKEEPAGFDLRFTVKLSLEDGSGKKFEQKAFYTVSTSPALVIVRAEGGG
jgi:hypothetical protein